MENYFEGLVGIDAYRYKLLNAMQYFTGRPVSEELLETINKRVNKIAEEAKEYNLSNLGFPIVIKCTACKYIFYGDGTYKRF